MFHVKTLGFELFLGMVTRNKEDLKSHDEWRPNGTKLFNAAGIRRINGASEASFLVEDDLGRLSSHSTKKGFLRFISVAPIQVTLRDQTGTRIFGSRIRKNEKGFLYPEAREFRSKKSQLPIKAEFPPQKAPIKKDDKRIQQDPAARRAERRNYAQKKSREERSRSKNWTPWPKKPLTTDQKNAMIAHCHHSPLTQKLVF